MTLTQPKRRACLLPQTSFGYRAFATSLSMCRTKNEPLSTQLVPNLPHGFTDGATCLTLELGLVWMLFLPRCRDGW